jgi:predicted unusual protein kinase regulating ubiquinone biosynthesis (AarF/ABC1/UbiB family)
VKILIFTSKLKTVLQVAVKVQYPGVAKSIQSDIRNEAVQNIFLKKQKIMR